MKKLLLLFTLVPCLAFGQMTYVPDDNFEQELIDLGYDTGTPDDSVPTANINTVTYLDVSSKNISDLTGIENFTSLTDLLCYDNQLTSLDVSQNTLLTQLYCPVNQLASLDVSNNTALYSLNCQFNQLTNLDVSQNTALVSLALSYNLISNLYLSDNLALHSLRCNDNLLTCLNIKNGNNINFTVLDAVNNPNLTCIEVDDPSWAAANWTVSNGNIDVTASFSIDCNNSCSGTCINDTILYDTTMYVVADSNLINVSPVIYLDSVVKLTTTLGCDSIINHYSEFVFSASFCTDTTEVFDTTFVQDTTFITINDTNTVNDTITYYDTVLVSVTDTLIIDVTLTGVSPPNNTNTLKVYPNPAKDQLYIDNGDYLSMSGYTLKIVNSVGQDVFSALITTPLFVIDISTLGSTGLYFIQVLDGSSNVLENKKLVLE